MKPDLESGSSARYKTVRELGRGEHTLVELVFDEKRSQLLARKSWERAGAELRFRLRQQYRRALGITHPNLVRVYDLVTEPERTALIMEAVDGRDVVAYAHELTLGGADTQHYLSAVLNVMAQLFEALSTLHAAGVVHRDLKPRNVLVEASGRCVLLDAGFTWGPERLFDPARERLLTAVLPYLAPECLRGALPSVESDWYSFGALSFELLSMEPPFSGNLDGVLREKESVAPLRAQLTAAPEPLADLVCALMARDPRARPTPDDIWEVLAPLVEAHPFEAPHAEAEEAPASEPPGKPSHMQLTAAGKAALDGDQPRASVEPLVSERTFDAPAPRVDEVVSGPVTAGRGPAGSASADGATATAHEVSMARDSATGTALDSATDEVATATKLGLDGTATDQDLTAHSDTNLHGNASVDFATARDGTATVLPITREATAHDIANAVPAVAAAGARDATADVDAATQDRTATALDPTAHEVTAHRITSRDDATRHDSPATPRAAPATADGVTSPQEATAHDSAAALLTTALDTTTRDSLAHAATNHATALDETPHAAANDESARGAIAHTAANDATARGAIAHAAANDAIALDETPHAAANDAIAHTAANDANARGAIAPEATALDADALDANAGSAIPLDAIAHAAANDANARGAIAHDADALDANAGSANPLDAPAHAAASDETARSAIALNETALNETAHAAADATTRSAIAHNATSHTAVNVETATSVVSPPDATTHDLRAAQDATAPDATSHDEAAPPPSAANRFETLTSRPRSPHEEDALRADSTLPSQPPPADEPSSQVLPAEPPAPENQQTPTLDPEPSRLAALCMRESGPSLTCLRGISGAGKSRLLTDLAQHIKQHSNACVLQASALPSEPLGLLRRLATQLHTALPDETAAALHQLTSAQRGALYKLCPELFAAGSAGEACAQEAQQQLIDALLGLRKVCLQLSAARRLIITLDDAHALDPDSAGALRALLCAAPAPAIAWLIAQPSDQAPLEPFASMLTSAVHAALPVRVHELDPLESRVSRTSFVPAHEPEPLPAPALAALGRVELTRMAETARDNLALHACASLYKLAVERGLPPDNDLLEAAARAQAAAGNLRTASKVWLGLARSTSVASDAQRFELEAGGALLRTGDEAAGRDVMRSVLRAVGLHWPRAPLLTSTLERVRVLLLSREQAHTQDLAAHALRFDALWGVAKELLLLAPQSGDALSVHALREARALGDPHRLALALGYEATSEANIGGAFMHKRAAALSGETRDLAERAAQAYDLAYARSVAAVVTWFTGDWADAENLLRDALSAYGQVQGTTAHERDVLQSFLVGALEAQGKIPQLREQLSEQRIAALVTGHQLALMLCELSDAGLPALADDRALAAIARADALLAEHPSDGFSPLHFQHFVVTTSARLYAGHSAQAYQQVEQTWQRVRHSYLPQLDAVAVMLHQLRARAALALAAHSPAAESERLRKQARKLATSLGHSNLAHALALRHVVEANLALLEKSNERAERHCKRAAEIFDAADMLLMREVAYYARAALLDEPSVISDRRRAEAFFQRVGVRVPAAFTAAWFPALRERLQRMAQLA